MKRIYLISVFYLVILTSWAQAPQLPSKCEAFYPEVLKARVLKESVANRLAKKGSDYGQSKMPASPEHWKVYSDRMNNPLYNSPGGSQIGSLEFNEEVYIALIKKDWAFVYSEKKNESWPIISNEAVAKGWIPMQNLLLWKGALANEASIFHKALFVENLDNMKDNSGQIYYDPEMRFPKEEISSDMNYYFILKTDSQKDMVLVAKTSVLGIGDPLYGWVSGSSYVSWNQRSCLEPNWDVHTIDAKLKGYTVKMTAEGGHFSAKFMYGKINEDYMKHLNEIKVQNLNADTSDLMKYRMLRGALRFPILDNTNNDNLSYRTTVFTTIDGSIEDATLINDRHTKLMKEIEEYTSTINLILVIDGTSSMEPYYASVQNAIRDCKYFSEEDFKFRVGLVIYRDYTDGDDGLIEYLPLRNKDDKRLVEYLQNGGRYGVKSHKSDRTLEEALYKGLEVAIDSQKMGFDSRENNIVVVIGDCGNAPNDAKALSQQELIDKMVKNNIQLLAFQVRNLNHPAFLSFNTQMVDIVSSCLIEQYKQMNAKARFDRLENGYDLRLSKSQIEQQYRTGSIRYTGLGTVMQVDELTTMLNDQIGLLKDKVTRKHSRMKNIASTMTKGVNMNVTKENKGASLDSAEFVRTFGLEKYKALRKRNNVIAFTGYLPKKNNASVDLWRPVVFLSAQEFSELMARLQPVYEVSKRANSPEARERYIAAMKALLKSLLPGITNEQMDNYGLEEAMSMINGLNESTKALQGPSLMDLANKDIVSNRELATLLNDFKRKYEKLQQIQAAYWFKLQNSRRTEYYWIPMEDMP